MAEISLLLIRIIAKAKGKKNCQLPAPLEAFLLKCSGVIISALSAGLSGLGLNSGWGQCVQFLGQTLLSQCLSPPRCIDAGGVMLCATSISSRGE